MEYKIKCLKFILFFTNGRQKLTAKGLRWTQLRLGSSESDVTSSIGISHTRLDVKSVLRTQHTCLSCVYTVAIPIEQLIAEFFLSSC